MNPAPGHIAHPIRHIVPGLFILCLAGLLWSPAFCSAEEIYILPTKQTYAPGEPIVVTIDGLPGNHQDWICLVPAGSSDEEWGEWFYTDGRRSLTYTFQGKPPGTYEVRVHLNWPDNGYAVAAFLPITVAGQ